MSNRISGPPTCPTGCTFPGSSSKAHSGSASFFGAAAVSASARTVSHIFDTLCTYSQFRLGNCQQSWATNLARQVTACSKQPGLWAGFPQALFTDTFIKKGPQTWGIATAQKWAEATPEFRQGCHSCGISLKVGSSLFGAICVGLTSHLLINPFYGSQTTAQRGLPFNTSKLLKDAYSARAQGTAVGYNLIFNLIQFGGAEKAKSWLQTVMPSMPLTAVNSISGALAGVVAGVPTTVLNGALKEALIGNSSFDYMKNIYTQDGVAGFLFSRGWIWRMFRYGVAGAVSVAGKEYLIRSNNSSEG